MGSRQLVVQSVLGLAALAAAAIAANPAFAQPYPAKPIRTIIPLAPGGAGDVVMRATGQELTKRLGQPIVLENRPGASGIIGAEACSKSVPDGYTLCLLYPDMTSFNPLFYAKLPYNADTDFDPIVHLVDLTTAITVPASLPVRSIAELRALAKARPGYLNFGSVGNGSEPHQFLEWLKQLWGVDIVHVAYKGGAPIAQALLTGEIQLTRVGLSTFIGQIKAGKLKVLAINARERWDLLPDAPTFAEVGLSGYTMKPWFGLVAPAGTPKPIITRLNAEIVQIFADPKFREQLVSQALVPTAGSPEEFALLLKSDREQAAQLLKITKVRPD